MIFFNTRTRIVILFLLVPVSIHNYIHGMILHNSNTEQRMTNPVAHEHWITIFVHGTCASSLAIVGLPKILSHNAERMLYEKFRHTTRKQYWFMAPTLGLTNIDPNNTAVPSDQQFAQLIVQAYDAVATTVHPDITNDYYLFGWNGFLSHKERCLESIRLYNELAQLVQTYRQRNITPKIRVIGYSHGGNVALNLGAIHGVINTSNTPYFYRELEYQAMQKLLDDPHAIQAKESSAMHLYTKPSDPSLSIDELILFAVPIQLETEQLCAAPLFKKVISCYSDNDVIQPLDIMTTRYRYCKRTLDASLLTTYPNSIFQIKIMMQRDLSPKKKKTFQNKTNEFLKNLNITALTRGGKPITPFHDDLTHTDFWWVTQRTPELFFSPLPFVIFTPVLSQLVQQSHGTIQKSYFDCNVTQETSAIYNFSLYLHNAYNTPLSQHNLAIKTIDTLRQQLTIAKNTL